jgi:hypothetical protein
LGFAAATYSTLPSPWPPAGDLGVSHDAELVTDQVHSRPAVTVRRPLPPAAATDDIEVAAVTVHLSSDGPVTVFDEVPHPAAKNAIAKLRQQKARFIFGRHLQHDFRTRIQSIDQQGARAAMPFYWSLDMLDRSSRAV